MPYYLHSIESSRKFLNGDGKSIYDNLSSARVVIPWEDWKEDKELFLEVLCNQIPDTVTILSRTVWCLEEWGTDHLLYFPTKASAAIFKLQFGDFMDQPMDQ